MKLLITIEGRFSSVGGDVFYHHLAYDHFWKRYLDVFDSVVVVARVKHVDKVPSNWCKSTGPGVEFCVLPDYHGPWQYLKCYHRVNACIDKAISQSDAFILRVPGIIGTVTWRHLMKKNIPYAVEVVADPWDSLGPGSVKTFLRPYLRRKMSRELALQCRHAAASAYVTEFALQNRYPPGHWTTFYTDTELPEKDIVGKQAVNARIQRAISKTQTGQPWRLVFVGAISQLYKAPDILIEAVAQCTSRGMNIELVMVGDGQYRSRLEQQVQRLGIGQNVKFLGMLAAGQEIFDQLDRADLFVLPSRQEGLPRTVVEAMGRATPCIGSTVGGFPELLAVEDLVPPADVNALSDKIIEVLGDVDRLGVMASRNLEKVNKKYHPDELRNRRIEFYERVSAQQQYPKP